MLLNVRSRPLIFGHGILAFASPLARLAYFSRRTYGDLLGMRKWRNGFFVSGFFQVVTVGGIVGCESFGRSAPGKYHNLPSTSISCPSHSLSSQSWS